MRKERYQLAIEKPCSESWSNMTPNENGRFCAHCSKTVVDFTNMTDKEIIRILKHNTNNGLCGRLKTDQLNRNMVGSPSFKIPYFPILLTGLLLLDISGVSFAKAPLSHSTQLVFSQKIQKDAEDRESYTDSTKNIFKGEVIDADTKKPIPNVTILIIPSRYGTTSDSSGKFNLLISTFFKDQPIELSFSYIGYKTQNLHIEAKDLKKYRKILLMSSDNILMGDTIYTTPIKKKRINK